MNKCDRLDMLKDLSMLDKYDDLHVFESYIPNHYDEIYSLYTLLIKSNVNYKDIDFDEPSENDGSFKIKFTCKENVFNKIFKFINKNKVIKYLRDCSFEVDITSSSIDNSYMSVIISFNKI